MSHSSDGGEDYWPGYVDALTSMVQVLAFVMMLLAVAVFVLSQSVSKGAVEQIAKAAKVDVPAEATVAELTAKVLEQLEKGVPQKQPVQPSTPNVKEKPDPEARTMASLTPYTTTKPTTGIAADKPPEASADTKILRVSFADRSYRIDPAQAEAITGFIESNSLANGKTRLTIYAYASDADGAVSEARRLAYYRGMVSRKALIDRKIAPETIEIRIFDTPDKQKGGSIDIVTGSEP